jgi:hypothetical protein
MNAFRIVRGRYGALDERYVVGASDDLPEPLRKIGDLEFPGDGQEFILAIQEA